MYNERYVEKAMRNLMENFMEKLNRLKSTRNKKILMSIYTPLFFIAAVVVFMGVMMYGSGMKNIQASYGGAMKRMAVGCEEKIASVVGGVQYLVKEESVMYFMNTNNPDLTKTAELNKAFADFADSYKGVIGAFILNINKKTVVDGTGEQTMTEYFGEYQYRNYPPRYWENIFLINNNSFRVLSPTVYSDANGEKNVIPIVFRKAGKEKSLNYLVINLDFDIFLERQMDMEIAKNSRMCVMNRYTGQIFGEKQGIADDNIISTELYSMLIGGKSGFYCDVDGLGKSFIVSYATSDKLVGYTYFFIIPNSYLNGKRASAVFVILIGVMICFAASYMLLTNIRGVMLPVNKIIDASGENGDVINLRNLEKQVEKLINQSAELKLVLPFVREQCLIKYLSSVDFYNSGDVDALIKKQFVFNRPYFSVVIIQMYPTDIFYDLYRDREYDNIRRGFYNVVEMLFKEVFDTIVLVTEKEALCVILNTDEPDEIEKNGIIDQIAGYLKHDMDYINLFVGTGGFYMLLDGMKQSYQEAVNSIRIVNKHKRNNVSGLDIRRNSMMLSGRDENLLFTALTEGRTDDAIEQIQKISEELETKDERIKKQLLTGILNVVLRVMNIKNIDFEGKMEYEIYNEVLVGSSNDIYRKILVLLNAFPEKTGRRTSKSETDRIIEYIQENHSNTDLSREMVADEFNIQPNYLSTLIKNRIGINFKDYLVNIRIEKAKELLANKKMSIQEIYEGVGFGSKQTFYRTFKRVEGITPSEYRRSAWEEKFDNL